MLSLLPGLQLRGIIQGDSVSKGKKLVPLTKCMLISWMQFHCLLICLFHSIPVFIPTLIELNRQGRFPYERMITYYEDGLNGVNQAVADAKNEAGNVIKPVLKISKS